MGKAQGIDIVLIVNWGDIVKTAWNLKLSGICNYSVACGG
jgi:hypothetical protein